VTALLITLTIIEIVAVAGVLVVYLLVIAGSLRRTAVLLGKVTFGVRAIETQCSSIGPSVLAVNGKLSGIAAALADLTALAGAGSGQDGAATRRR
jgi:hypothetical protein